jgi:L-iditol 2-dehydrogenase
VDRECLHPHGSLAADPSEIHFWKHGRIGDVCVTHDLILGHESAGQIIQVGANVRNFAVGDRVSIEPGISCWECDMCLRGRYNLCPRVEFSGTPPSHGTMRRFVAHPARFLHRIPDDMSYALGALVEPLSVGYNAVRRAEIYLGQPVVVAGAGPIGLAAALNARAAGASPLLITDLEAGKLAQAAEFGFATLQVSTKSDRNDTAARIRTALGCAPQLVLECTGSEASINSACYALEEGGTLLQVGCGKPDVSLPLMSMGFREINVITSFRYMQSWPVVIRLIQAGVYPDLERMITHKFPLESMVDAFEQCLDKEAIKVQIVDE